MLSDLISDERYPDELVNLYNPAYVAGLIYLAGVNFQAKKKQGMPIYFAYIILPLLAVDKTRERVPSKATGRMADWVAKNGDAFINFPERVIALKPFVASGLIYLKKYKLVDIPSGVELVFKKKSSLVKLIGDATLSSEYVRDELDKAPVVGRLLAGGSDTASILAYFGLTP